MACGCRKNNNTTRGTTSAKKSDLSQYAYLTPRQLRLKQKELEKQDKEGNKEE